MAPRLTRRRFLASASAAALLGGCQTTSTNKATGRETYTAFYSVEDDIELGRQEHPKLVQQFGGEYDNPKLQRYLTNLGNRLASGTEYTRFPYRFTLLNSPIVNAFALPGGFVYVSRGLLPLASNEAELAGVLSHELGHVNARHTAERLSQAKTAQYGLLTLSVLAAAVGVPGQAVNLLGYGAQAYLQSYSRKQEFEADSLGVRYMARQGYDPDAMVSFLDTLRDQSAVEAKVMGLPEGSVDEYNMMSTHPRTVDRVREAIAQAEALRPPQPVVNRHEYLNQIDGMLFGDDPKEGIVRGRTFSHRDLRLTFEVPEGFRLRNSASAVAAQHSNGSLIRFDSDRSQSGGGALGYLQRQLAPKYQLAGMQRLTINDLDAATGVSRLQTDGGSVYDVRFVVIQGDGSTVFRFLFATPPQVTAQMTDGLKRTTYSFRRLGQREAAAIRPLTLDITVARRGDTVESLSRSMPYGQWNPDFFRLFNDLKPGQPVAEGARIKVVT